MNLTIKDNRAVSEKIGFIEYSKIKTKFEGRTSFLKDGSFSFENTKSNIDCWKLRYPETIITNDTPDKFELYVAENRPLFAFKRDPLWYQQDAFDKFKNNKLTALQGQVGSGKSKILSDYLSYKYCEGEIDAVIIIAINHGVINQWHDLQLPRDIGYEYKSWVWNKSKSGLDAYESLKEYNGLQIITINIDALRTPKGKKLCLDFIKRHKGRILFAIDESQTIKTASSIRTKLAIELSLMCSHRSILTGTPIAKNLLDYWSQFNALDFNIIGCKYASSFKAKYCLTRWNGFGNEIIGSKNEEELYAKTEPYTFRITKAELGFKDFDDEFYFELGTKEQKHYNELKKTFLTQINENETLSVTIALTQMLRLQQISNGYLVKEDGKFELLECSRLVAFDSYLETLCDNKIVVWCRFKQDVKLLLDKYGKSAIDLSGNSTPKERQVNKEKFLSNNEIRFAFATYKAAGVGTDGLQSVTNRACFFSNTFDSLDYWQARGRTSRIGGDNNAFYGHIVGKGTQDKKIITSLAKKEALSSLVLDDFRKMFE